MQDDNMTFPAQDLLSQAELVASWTGVIKPQPWDMFFLVVGRTGSGKSTFIGHCTGRSVTVGHGLYSCTNEVTVSDYQWNGRRIFLIDTPGFNDTSRPDAEILEMLAVSLSTSYGNGVRLHGIIMLHPMSDNRMSGSSMRTIEMMKAMCGFDRYDNLAIVTTMWPEPGAIGDSTSTTAAAAAREQQFEARYAELCSEGRFFGEFVQRGAAAFRYKGTGCGQLSREEEMAAAAQRIVAHLVRRSDMHPLGPLRLQHEILVERKTLGQTEAGRVVAGDLRRSHQTQRARLQQVEGEMIASGGEESKQKQQKQQQQQQLVELRKLKKDLLEELRLTEAGTETLQKSLEDMHRDSLSQCRKSFGEMDERFRAHIVAKELELRNVEAALRVQEHQRRQQQQQQQQLERAIRAWESRRGSKSVSEKKQSPGAELDQSQSLGTLRNEVTQAREAHSKFTMYKGQILNGATNGIAAGLTAGALAAAAAGGTGLLLCTVM